MNVRPNGCPTDWSGLNRSDSIEVRSLSTAASRKSALHRPVGAFATAIGLLAPSAAHAAGALNIIPEPWKVVQLLVLFVVLVPVLNALLFQPLLLVLDEREKRIEGARTRARDLAAQAGALLARHDDAIRQARQVAHAEQVQLVEQARGTHRATVGDARAAAERDVSSARAELTRVADGVRASLGAEAEPLAREIAARLLGRSAS